MESKSIFLLFFLLFLSVGAQAQEKYVSSSADAAFEGYDLVSYHQGDAPKKGKPEYKTTYDGLILYFFSKDNLEAFKKDPESYLPAYGGYCATACSNGNFVTPDYNNFSIENNQLYLFEVRGFWNGKTAWNKDPEKNKIKADQNYNNKVLKNDGKK